MTLHTFADGSIGPLNHPSPFDAAWRTRVPSSWSTPSDDQPKRRMGSSSGWDCRAYSPIGVERKAALAAITAKTRETETAAAAKPFRFEDLNGKPEPEAWGPAYDIKKRRGQSVGDAVREAQNRWWRNDPPFKSNSASGQSGEFNAKKYRAQLQASFMAQCNKDKRDWAMGQAIRDAYEAAMAAKRKRLEGEARQMRKAA
jgi:hypothetical protein